MKKKVKYFRKMFSLKSFVNWYGRRKVTKLSYNNKPYLQDDSSK